MKKLNEKMSEISFAQRKKDDEQRKKEKEKDNKV